MVPYCYQPSKASSFEPISDTFRFLSRSSILGEQVMEQAQVGGTLDDPRREVCVLLHLAPDRLHESLEARP